MPKTSVQSNTLHDMQCSICLENLCKPRLFNCGHHFCENCALAYVEEKLHLSKTDSMPCGWVKCPTCRQESFVFTQIDEESDIYSLMRGAGLSALLRSAGISKRHMSLAYGTNVVMTQYWLGQWETLERAAVPSFRKSEVRSHMKTLAEVSRQNSARAHRLHQHERRLRRAMLSHLDNLCAAEGDKMDDAVLKQNLIQKFQVSVDQYALSWQSVLDDIGRWKTISSVYQFIIDEHYMPCEEVMTDLLQRLDVFLIGAQDNMTAADLETRMTKYKGWLGDINVMKQQQMWLASFYDGTGFLLKMKRSGEHEPDEWTPATTFQFSSKTEATTFSLNHFGSIEMRCQPLWTLEKRGSSTSQFFWPVDTAFVHVNTAALDQLGMPQCTQPEVKQGVPTITIAADDEASVTDIHAKIVPREWREETDLDYSDTLPAIEEDDSGPNIAGEDHNANSNSSIKTSLVIAVCDKNNCRIQFFGSSLGKYLGSITRGIKPKRVAQDRLGYIHVSDEAGGCVKVYNKNLRLVGRWGDRFFWSPAGIVCLDSGEIVMTDVERYFVSFHTPWSTEKSIMSYENRALLARDSFMRYLMGYEGSTSTAHSSMGLKKAKESALKEHLEQLERSAQLRSNSSSLETVKCEQEVLTHDLVDGKVLGELCDVTTGLKFKFTTRHFGEEKVSNPYYVAVDEKWKHVWVTDSYNNAVKIYNMNGKLLKYIGGHNMDCFDSPFGIAMVEAGQALVADCGQHRIVLITLTNPNIGSKMKKPKSVAQMLLVQGSTSQSHFPIKRHPFSPFASASYSLIRRRTSCHIYSDVDCVVIPVIKDIAYPMGLAYNIYDGLLAVTQGGYSNAHSVTLYRLEFSRIYPTDNVSSQVRSFHQSLSLTNPDTSDGDSFSLPSQQTVHKKRDRFSFMRKITGK